MHFHFLKKINNGMSQFFFLLIIKLSFIKQSYSISIKLNKLNLPSISLNQDFPELHLRNLSEQHVYGSAFKINYYYSNLYLGEKMHKQGYILDTGSTITTATCGSKCTHCGLHLNPHYDSENLDDKIILCSDPLCKQVTNKCQSVSHPKECSFTISYSEGSSLTGVYIYETLRFGNDYKNKKGYKIPIGCTTDENHLFFTQDANGIMGLANTENNFIEILYKNGAINNSIFSLCFAQLGGLFNIGEINNKTHLEKMKYVPMLLDRGKYFGINILSISVNNHTVKNYEQYSYNIFIDSGTTICYINEKIFDEILTLMNKECSKFPSPKPCGDYKYHSDFGHCFYFKTTDELDFAVYNYWPTIHFYLNKYDYIWRPKYYVFNITNGSKVGACMGINKSGGTKITLGSSWIIGHDIIFDRKKKLIGIAEANCSLTDEINKTSGLELIKDDYRLKIRNISSYNNTNKIGSKNNDKNMNINSDTSNNKFDNIIIWQYVILAILSFILFIIIFTILCLKYFKKNDMKQMNIEIENNSANINIKKDERSYKKISTEADSKESKDNKDNQAEIVIES